jgi:hypothetical protein
MSEPINLDELLSNSSNTETTEEQIETTETTTDASEQDINTDDSVEGEGVVDSNEDTGSQQDETIEENTEASGVVEDQAIQDNTADDNSANQRDNESDNTPAEPVEYKFKDNFIKKAVEYYEMYGTLEPFIEKANVNYDEVADLDLLKMAFDKENDGLAPKTKQKLFEKELSKYNLDAYDEDDLEVGEDLLRRDAQKLRTKLKAEQQEFLSSIQPEEKASQVDPAQISAQQEQQRKAVEQGVAGVVKNNLIRLEANGEGLNYQIADVNKVVDYALDSSKFLSVFAKDGGIDWDKWTKVVAFAENPTAFTNELIKHGKSLGRKAMESELKNVKPVMTSSSKEIVESVSENPYEDKIGFLKGMTITKK